MITDLEDQQQHAQDVSSTTISDNDTSLDVVNVSDVQQQQQQTPPPPPTGPTPGAAVASMVYQLPPISTAMNFAYAPPPPELASGSPSPASSHHSGEHPDFLQHLPSAAASHAPPHPPTSASSAAVTAISSTPLAYNLLPAIDILRTSSGPAGSSNLWSLDHC